jgi:hypothetical protein
MATSPIKKHKLCGWSRKTFAGKGDVQHEDLKAEAGHRRNLQKKLHLQDQKEINLILHSSQRSFLKTVEVTIDVGKGEIK